jgi:hypothetical protein
MFLRIPQNVEDGNSEAYVTKFQAHFVLQKENEV